ncbi:hypothetical protein D3C79_1102140 [compost metagenome]
MRIGDIQLGDQNVVIFPWKTLERQQGVVESSILIGDPVIHIFLRVRTECIRNGEISDRD